MGMHEGRVEHDASDERVYWRRGSAQGSTPTEASVGTKSSLEKGLPHVPI